MVGGIILATALVALGVLFARRRRRHGRSGRGAAPLEIGIFHPYCNAGGGGERVLWFAVQAILSAAPTAKLCIYARRSSGEPAAILGRASERFGIPELDGSRISFVFLATEKLLDAETFPRLTLLGQSLGSMVVGLEALWRGGCPDVFFDTMGYAFTYPLAWAAGATVASYTHYPTISTDMLSRVYERRPAYNNDELVSGSVVNSRLKYAYYVVFCAAYRVAGRFAQVVMVNSNWTRGHIEALWGTSARVVFPPCDTREFSQAATEPKRRVIVSLGQFRPEKDHRLQIQALAALKVQLDAAGVEVPALEMLGSCRGAADEQRVAELRAFAAQAGVGSLVHFRLNEPFSQVKTALGSALLGVHTMWNEHFGIAPVEMMAAGVVLVAHCSGGPKLDIVADGETGFLASSAAEYAAAFARMLALFDAGGSGSAQLARLRAAALASTARFSQDQFAAQLLAALAPLLPPPPPPPPPRRA